MEPNVFLSLRPYNPVSSEELDAARRDLREAQTALTKAKDQLRSAERERAVRQCRLTPG